MVIDFDRLAPDVKEYVSAKVKEGRLVGVNPEAYIRWVLPKLASATNKTAVDMMPHDYAKLYPDQLLG